MVGTRSLSSGARSRDPVALPTLRECEAVSPFVAVGSMISFRSIERGC